MGGKSSSEGGGKNRSGSDLSEKAAAEQEQPINEVLAGSQDGSEAVKNAVRDLQSDAPAASDLQLSSLMIEDAGVMKLSQSIAKSTHLRVLNLGVNRLTDACIDALAGVLPASKLEVLILERNSITSVGIIKLAKVLPPSLERLMIGRNAVATEGARALAESVIKLHTLGLGFANLNPEGAQALVPILSKVKVLDVAGNHLRGDGCAYIAAGLKDSQLETLKLESNGVGDDGSRELCRALTQNNNLLVLSVRRNSVTDVGAKMFAEALEQSRKLQQLDLFDNSITDAGATALLEAARKGKRSGSALSKLDLDINEVSPALKSDIAAALK